MAVRSDAELLRALLELQRDLALEVDLGRILERIARAAVDVLAARGATIYVVDAERGELFSRVITGTTVREIRLPLDGRGLAAEVARTGRTLRIADAYGDARFNPEIDARSGQRTRTLLVAPIDGQHGRRIGVLQAVNRSRGAFTAKDEKLAQALASSAAIALEHSALHGELREERLRVLRVGEETRRRLARELHDTVAQTLANAAIAVEAVARRAPSDVKGAVDELAVLRAKLLDAQRVLRDILSDLRPLALETGGLGEAARALAQRLDGTRGVAVDVRRVDAGTRLRPEVEAGAFAVLREAANNAIKHGAKRVAIDALEERGETVLRVEDDGEGFDVGGVLRSYAARGSLGLLQIRESARAIGADLLVDSAPGRGTRVVLRVPHESPAPEAVAT